MASTILTTKTRCGLTLARMGSLTYPLTPCCGASVTGTGDGIVACRECYQELTGAPWGDCAVDLAGIVRLVRSVGCPCPVDCAFQVEWELSRD